jgi:hypothetical protein
MGYQLWVATLNGLKHKVLETYPCAVHVHLGTCIILSHRLNNIEEHSALFLP